MNSDGWHGVIFPMRRRINRARWMNPQTKVDFDPTDVASVPTEEQVEIN